MKNTRECIKCGEIKQITEFNKSFNEKYNKYYIKTICRNCQNVEYKKWANNNKEKLHKRNVKYYNENKEEVSISNREYFQKNKEILRIKRKEYMKEYQKNRRICDNNFRLISLYRSRLYKAIKYGWYSKDTQNIIGCSLNELKKHLQSKFTNNMKWSNYGKIWELDHVKPCIEYNVINKNELYECFNYKNIRPLLKYDNIIKKDKEV